jgi:hypothetical protein
MSTSDPSLPAHWQFYADRARQTNHGLVDDFGYGREELLWETLAVIESGIPFTDDCRQRLDRIPRNRAKKHRRLRRYLLGGPSSAVAQDDSIVEVADSVEQVRGMLSPAEWEVEWRLAIGQTYAEVALDQGLSPDALKVRVSRCRARIRRKLEIY